MGQLRSGACGIWPRDAGITLMEMLAVLAIMSLVVAVALSSFRTSNAAVRLRPLIAELAGVLKIARAAAITGNRPVSVLLDPVTRTYRVEGVRSPIKLPDAVSLSFAGG